MNFSRDWTLHLCRHPEAVAVAQEPPCSGSAGADKEPEAPALRRCAARTRSEQPGADASRCFYNTNPKAPLSKCKHTLVGQPAPASDNWARSLPGTRCRAPSTSKKRAVFTRIFKARYCLGRTHAQARNHRNGEAREPRQWRERQRFKYFRQRFSKAEIAYNSHPNSREPT